MGICGTAMASLAALLKQQGYEVYGADEGVYPPMSTFLEQQGISVYEGYASAHLNPPPDLVIVGNVISRGNPEIEKVLEQRLPYTSLPDAIREFLIRDKRSIVVTGTHGKTTTTALLAWMLESAGRHPGFLLGGLTGNFGRGFQLGCGEDFIVEGDEYDSAFFDKVAKFLRYSPQVGIINHLEFDHADIYESFSEIRRAFVNFVNLIPRNGLLVACSDVDEVKTIAKVAPCPVQTFALDDTHADWRAVDIHPAGERTAFTVLKSGTEYGAFETPLWGRHNVRNILAAITVSDWLGITCTDLQEANATFRGIRRRLELKGNVSGIKIYDDFGHHPTAIHETLLAFRTQFPDAGIWALFEPRTATTRRDIFQNDLIRSFEPADHVLIAPVHRPDKAPSGHVFSSEQLEHDLRQTGRDACYCASIDAMIQEMLPRLVPGDCVITFSNGPFGGIHQKLLDALQ
jgi:UDP-N-acetylmuramate: L-alanyl-gamma-D-glutamyl-meso-diaminopimelate ligase